MPMDSWRDGTQRRWDDNLSEADPEHARAGRLTVSGLEAGMAHKPPQARALQRQGYAPLYYDTHRSARLANAPDAGLVAARQQHISTMWLAEKLATLQPPDLQTALAAFSGKATPTQIRDEYLLWRYSLRLASTDDWPDRDNARVGPTAGLRERPATPEDAERLDVVAGGTLGQHLRGPQVASVAFADTSPTSAMRAVNVPSGNALIGAFAPGPGANAENRRTTLEALLHSVLARHWRPERAAFDQWGRDALGKEGLSPLGQALGAHQQPGADGKPGDYSDELASALLHAIYDVPSLPPGHPMGPSRRAIANAALLFERTPTTKPARFRDHAPFS